MQAIVLAAGRGSRMDDTDGRPKLLLELHGQTLLERQLETLSSIGVTAFVIVVGYRGDMVEHFIAERDLAQRYDLRVVHNKRWQEGNASSILAARRCVRDERFMVVMGDHLFDPQGLRGILEAHGDFVGVFDSAPRFVDLSEATRAMGHRGRITAIGKELTAFRYVDTGMFICPQQIFAFIEECLAEGIGSFNEIKSRWIARNPMHFYDCRGAFWMDVDTPQDLVKACEHIDARLSRARDGVVSRALNRRLSAPLSRWLVEHTRVTPNQLSAGAFALALASAALFCWPSWVASAAGGLLAEVSSVVDGCDGEVARLRRMSTAYGAWLDAVLDRMADALLLGGMAFGGWLYHRAIWVWPVGFAALAGAFAVSYTEARYEAAFGQAPVFGDGLPAKRDTRMLLIMLGGVTRQMAAALALIATLTLAEVARRWWVTSRFQGDRAAQPRAPSAGQGS
jgi:choline kinase/phosphatidylglycerophosphate synthase